MNVINPIPVISSSGHTYQGKHQEAADAILAQLLSFSTRNQGAISDSQGSPRK